MVDTYELFIIGTLVDGTLIQEKDEQHYYMLPSNNLSHYLATVFHVALVTSYIWTLVYSTYVTSNILPCCLGNKLYILTLVYSTCD